MAGERGERKRLRRSGRAEFPPGFLGHGRWRIF